MHAKPNVNQHSNSNHQHAPIFLSPHLVVAGSLVALDAEFVCAEREEVDEALAANGGRRIVTKPARLVLARVSGANTFVDVCLSAPGHSSRISVKHHSHLTAQKPKPYSG
jgi:hypothetical protein